jgi:hypothetical protein
MTVATEAMAAFLRDAEAELGQTPWTLAQVEPRPHPIGTVREIAEVALRVLAPRGEAFMSELRRWRGPDPYPAKQTRVGAHPWKNRLDAEDVERIMDGEIRAMISPRNRIDLVMRDHHVLDALLYVWDAHGRLPRGPMLHLDRHSDFEPIVPWHGQANGWWGLLAFLLRPDPPHRPILDPARVIYGNALEDDRSKYHPPMIGELNGAHAEVPPSHAGADISLEAALARAEVERPDVVSVDLDLLMPEAQLARGGWILTDPRYLAILSEAAVAVFALSPQFARGGDRVPPIARATSREICEILNRVRRA